MGSLQDTFKPVNVAKERGRFGEEEDVIGKSAEALPPLSTDDLISKNPGMIRREVSEEKTPLSIDDLLSENPGMIRREVSRKRLLCLLMIYYLRTQG